VKPFEAAHLRHAYTQNDKIRSLSLIDSRNSLFSAARHVDVISIDLQQRLEKPSEAWLGVHDEDFLFQFHRLFA
jgi:hypothetical protein